MNVDGGWVGAVLGWLRLAAALIVVNALLLLGTAAGAVVLGVVPAARAATAAFTALRDGSVDGYSRLFVRTYRRQFLRANRRGAVFVVAGVLLGADVAVLSSRHDPLAAALAAATAVIVVIVGLAFAAWCAIEQRYDGDALATLRYAVVLPLVSPVMSLSLLLSLAAIGLALSVLPPLAVLVGASIPLFVATWFVDHRLSTLDPGHPRAARAPAPATV